MDIDTNYINTLSNQAVSNANSSKLKDTLSQISSSSSGKTAEASSEEDAKLLDACKQFESYFVEQMYKKMLDTVPKSELDTGSNEMLVDYYKENLVKEYAEQTTETGDLGLAQMLYEQMKRNIGMTAQEAEAKAAETTETTAASETIAEKAEQTE